MSGASAWRWLGGACLAAVLAGVAGGAEEATAPAGLDLAGMDTSVRPGDDFFGYANGGWLRATQIPADRGSYGSLAALAERTEVQLGAIVQKASQSSAPAGSDLRLVGDYYAAFMDEDGIEARGLHPMDMLHGRIYYMISDRHELSRFIGETLRADVDALNATQVATDNLFGLWIAQDLDTPERYVPFLLQGGLGMPDRKFYLDPAPAMAAVRSQYEQHLVRLLQLAGVADAAGRARRIVALEQRIAAAHWTRDETRDVRKGDNHWRRADFGKLAPGIDWTVLFEAAGVPPSQHDFIVWQPSAIRGIAALVGSESLQTWRDYLWAHALERRAQVLPKAFGDESFAFYGKVLGDVPAPRARWKRALAATNAALGDAVGRLYVMKYFPPETKARVEALAEDVRGALRRRIDQADWLSPGARAVAQAKLAALQLGIGYPEQWRDYAALHIARNDAFGNAERAAMYEYAHQLAKLGHKVDRSEWVVTPQTVNAVDLPALNAINLPAAILQEPLYGVDRDAALNYGAIGALIGHELSHSFDDRGGRFDASGRLHDWWSDADTAHLRAAGERLAAQFSAYQALPDRAVDGHLTLGENIADLAGLVAALDAYHERAGAQGLAPLGGFSADQRFFIAYAQFWRVSYREATLRARLISDQHAPGQYRAATVRNVDAWYAAFDVRPGQALYIDPAERVRIW